MKNNKKIQFNNLISQSDGSNGLKKSKKSGYTLIELIVVVAIIAVLVVFSTSTFVSVTRRKATRVGKIIDSELTMLASNAFSRDGYWRLVFEYDPKEEGYVMVQQFNTSDDPNGTWHDFSRTPLSPTVDLSFGNDEFDDSEDPDNYYISVSREKGCYLTEDEFDGYFCGNIYVRSAEKIVSINMSKESGGHRVVD